MRGVKRRYCKKCGRDFPDRRATHKKKGEYQSRLDHIKECYGICREGTRNELLNIYRHFFQVDPPLGGETEEAKAQRTIKAWKTR